MLGSVTWAVDTAAVGPAAALVGLAQRPTHHLLDRRHILHQLAAALAQGGGGKVLEIHRIASKGRPRESEVEFDHGLLMTALRKHCQEPWILLYVERPRLCELLAGRQPRRPQGH